MRSGVAIGHVEVGEPALDPVDEVVGADDVGAGLLGGPGGVAGGEHRLTGPCPAPRGNEMVPRIIWSALRVYAEVNAASTVSSNFLAGNDFISANASSAVCSRVRSKRRVASTYSCRAVRRCDMCALLG